MTTDHPLYPERTEDVHPGITCEWFFGSRVVVYRIKLVSPTMIEAWSKTALRLLEGWPKSSPYLALHDVSAPGVSLQYASLVGYDLMNIGITQKGRELAEEVFNDFPDFRARVAISFNLSVSGQVSQVVMDRIKAKHPSIQYKTFFNRERSLSWLMEHLENGSTAAPSAPV